jgi:hypothetical protein
VNLPAASGGASTAPGEELPLRRLQALFGVLLDVRVLALGADATNRQIQIARQHLDKIMKSDCREGEKTELCDGQAGDLEILRKRYDQRAASAQEVCPGQVIFDGKAPKGVSDESLRDGVPQPREDLATLRSARTPQSLSDPSPGPVAEPAPAVKADTSSSPNIFQKIWGGIRRFFGFY